MENIIFMEVSNLTSWKIQESTKVRLLWLCIILHLSLNFFDFFSDSEYMRRLIRTIDKADSITISTNGVDTQSFVFDDVIPYFAYGDILEVKKPWTSPLHGEDKKYIPTNLKIKYYKNNNLIGESEVLKKCKPSDKYIFFMNGVYYCGDKHLDLLLNYSI